MDTSSYRPVKNYEGLYEINRHGVVRSLHKRNFQKVMPHRIDRGGYYTVRLSKNSKDSTVYVHRLLAFAFIENPFNKPCVNHLDGDKLNNELENLEWVTTSENMKHAYNMGLVNVGNLSKAKKVIDTCKNITYSSIYAACKESGVSYSHFRRIMAGKAPNTTCFQLVA